MLNSWGWALPSKSILTKPSNATPLRGAIIYHWTTCYQRKVVHRLLQLCNQVHTQVQYLWRLRYVVLVLFLSVSIFCYFIAFVTTAMCYELVAKNEELPLCPLIVSKITTTFYGKFDGHNYYCKPQTCRDNSNSTSNSNYGGGGMGLAKGKLHNSTRCILFLSFPPPSNTPYLWLRFLLSGRSSVQTVGVSKLTCSSLMITLQQPPF